MRELHAIVFDVDGTLYQQDRLRRKMLIRLLSAHATCPVNGWRNARILRAYRKAQEDLRISRVTHEVAEAQVTRTCQRTNVNRDAVVQCVLRWMEQEPLVFLPTCIQPGLREFLTVCRSRGVPMGALSDYPAQAKLQALGIAPFFDVVLCAQDRAVDCFKPNPRGLLVAIERLSSMPSRCLYVGDRLDVDAPTAEAAGTHCAIVAKRHNSKPGSALLTVTDFTTLHDELFR